MSEGDRIAELERALAKEKASHERTYQALREQARMAEGYARNWDREVTRVNAGLAAALRAVDAERGRTAEKFRRLRERVRVAERLTGYAERRLAMHVCETKETP